MAFNVIAKPSLKQFWEQHQDSEGALRAWYKLMTKSEARSFVELKQSFASADFVRPDYIIFNIKGNHYRLIVSINFEYKTIWIKHIVTHAEYDKLALRKVKKHESSTYS